MHATDQLIQTVTCVLIYEQILKITRIKTEESTNTDTVTAVCCRKGESVLWISTIIYRLVLLWEWQCVKMQWKLTAD